MTGASLSCAERGRYDRQLRLPGWGEDAQELLRDAAVLVVGLGGLGSAAALYLAAAGVGCIGLVDPGLVELSNLHRQVIHSQAELGQPKVLSARRRLEALNSRVVFLIWQEKFTAATAARIGERFPFVLDCTDNLTARQAVNRWCAAREAVHVYGSVHRYEGQLSVFDARQGPCWACVFGGKGLPGAEADQPVLGTLPGMLGTLMAQETIKLITGIGRTLIGSLLLVDGRENHIETIRLTKQPDCPVCGQNRS